MKNITLLFLALAACKSSDAGPAADAVPCDPAATELVTRLDAANGMGMEYSDPKRQPAMDAAKAGLDGKRYAFKNCYFSGQGNDEVSFAAADGARSLTCALGADGHKKFRKAAMKFELAKLKLDVTGIVKTHEGRLALTECKITPHE
jgi:hypothetical protein